MDDSTPWWAIANLMKARGTPAEIPKRLRTWREARGWSLEQLARELSTLSSAAGKGEYRLAKPALLRIEHGERSVSFVEALGLAEVFGKSIAELVLPDGSIEEASEWLLFDQAARELNTVRNAAAEYELLIARLRNRIGSVPRLREYVEREAAAAGERDEAAHRAAYDRRQHVWQLLQGTALEEPPLPAFEDWRKQHFLSPTPRQITAEHVLSANPIDSELWYLGWDAKSVRDQFRWRQKARSKK